MNRPPCARPYRDRHDVRSQRPCFIIVNPVSPLAPPPQTRPAAAGAAARQPRWGGARAAARLRRCATPLGVGRPRPNRGVPPPPPHTPPPTGGGWASADHTPSTTGCSVTVHTACGDGSPSAPTTARHGRLTTAATAGRSVSPPSPATVGPADATAQHAPPDADQPYVCSRGCAATTAAAGHRGAAPR